MKYRVSWSERCIKKYLKIMDKKEEKVYKK